LGAGFLCLPFEAVALGVGYNYKLIASLADKIPERVQTMWGDPTFYQNSGSGIRASSRVPKIVPYGRSRFAP
jgi:hypothetical protein